MAWHRHPFGLEALLFPAKFCRDIDNRGIAPERCRQFEVIRQHRKALGAAGVA